MSKHLFTEEWTGGSGGEVTAADFMEYRSMPIEELREEVPSNCVALLIAMAEELDKQFWNRLCDVACERYLAEKNINVVVRR